MWTRTARACALVALAFAAMPAGVVQAQAPESLEDLIRQLPGATSTSTTPAPAATTPAPETPAPTQTAPAAPTATAPAAPTPPADATAPGAAAPTPAPPPTEQPPAGVTDEPIAAAAEEDQGSTVLPAVLVALAVLAVVLLLGILAWALARWFAFDPRWLRRWRHASREAAYRASGVWGDFTDWVKLGR